jgi:membrane dipeptidase
MVPILDMHADVFMDLVRRYKARNAKKSGNATKAHNADVKTISSDNRVELEERHLNRIKSGGIAGAVLIDCRMAGESALPEHLEQFIATVKRELAAAGNNLIHIKSAADLARAVQTNTFAAIVGYEGLSPTKGELAWIPRLYDEAGLRVAVLTHNDDNDYGGGALGARGGAQGSVNSGALGERGALGTLGGQAAATGQNAYLGTPALGLTEKGRQAVALMNELGILIDMSHAGKATRRDILAASARPVMLSHTSAKAVYDNGRNLTDEEMRAIADSGGIIGCMTSPAALAPLADRAHHSLERYMQHLTHMIGAAGVDHVGLGLHFCEYLYTREEYPLIGGLEDASRAQAIIEELLIAGYSRADVEKIAWRNFARVFGEAVG